MSMSQNAKAKVSDASSKRDKDAMQSDHTSQDASQVVSDGVMGGLLAQKNKTAKENRDKRKAALKQQHRGCIRKIRGDLQGVASVHERDLRALRRLQVEKVQQLFSRTDDLENNIGKCIATLEQAFNTASKELGIATNGRDEDLARPLQMLQFDRP